MLINVEADLGIALHISTRKRSVSDVAGKS